MSAKLFEQATIKLINKNYVEACQDFANVLLEDPNNAMAWNNRGLCLQALGHPFDAALHHDNAISLSPGASAFLCNRGVCSYLLERYDDAIKFYRRALLEDSTNPEVNMNMGNVMRMRDRIDEAIYHYRQGLKGRPDYMDCKLALSMSLLQAGQYEEGWKTFECRWKTTQLPPRGIPVPPWDGEDLAGKRIMVYSEQGHGDCLQFARYGVTLKERYPAATVFLEVRSQLYRLISTIGTVDGVVIFGDKVPSKLDYVCPMMSMPRLMGTTIETIPVKQAWYHTDETRRAIWRDKLKAFPKKGLNIGICWAGMSRPGRPEADAIDRRRSTALINFAPVMLTEGVNWVSLQQGPPREQVSTPIPGMTIGDWMDEADDFYDTAALIEELDLVISVDTAVAHVAASVGKPTWVLSRFDNCWRWLGRRSDSPWYPTVRQFVQHKPNDWSGLMGDVARSLREFVEVQNAKAAA